MRWLWLLAGGLLLWLLLRTAPRPMLHRPGLAVQLGAAEAREQRHCSSSSSASSRQAGRSQWMLAARSCQGGRSSLWRSQCCALHPGHSPPALLQQQVLVG